MNYYDVYDILASEEPVSVIFNEDVREGIISNNKRLYSGQKVELPYFAVEFLLKNEHCRLTDSVVSDQIRNDLDAGPSLVDLGSRAPHFYTMAKNVYHDKKYITDIFFSRIGKYFQIILKEEFSEEDTAFLSMEERRLVVSSRHEYRAFVEYERGKESGDI